MAEATDAESKWTIVYINRDGQVSHEKKNSREIGKIESGFTLKQGAVSRFFNRMAGRLSANQILHKDEVRKQMYVYCQNSIPESQEEKKKENYKEQNENYKALAKLYLEAYRNPAYRISLALAGIGVVGVTIPLIQKALLKKQPPRRSVSPQQRQRYLEAMARRKKARANLFNVVLKAMEDKERAKEEAERKESRRKKEQQEQEKRKKLEQKKRKKAEERARKEKEEKEERDRKKREEREERDRKKREEKEERDRKKREEREERERKNKEEREERERKNKEEREERERKDRLKREERERKERQQREDREERERKKREVWKEKERIKKEAWEEKERIKKEIWAEKERNKREYQRRERAKPRPMDWEESYPSDSSEDERWAVTEANACPDRTKVRNPLSGRCIAATGERAKELRKQGIIR